jgi:putative ABC transport system permease protein
VILELFFRVALRAYPSSFRRRFQDAMTDTFLEGLEEHRRAGAIPAIRFAIPAVVNVVTTGLRERSRPSVRDRSKSLGSESVRVPRMRQWPLDLAREVKLALRSFRKRPGFAVLAVSTLALGVGATTAILSVVEGVLLEPLPYPESERLVNVLSDWSGADARPGGLSYPDLVDLENETHSFESLVGTSASSMTLTGLGEPTMIEVTRLTRGLMGTFRVTPLLGRDIRADEFGKSGPAVAVVSRGFWQARFGASESAVGEKLLLDGVSYEIVGVAPRGFDFPAGAQIWIPFRLDLEGCGRGCHTMTGVGRLAPGLTLEEARSESLALAARLASGYPETNTNKGFLVQSLKDRMVGDVRHGLLLLLGAVGLVVLIACANVANLLLARGSTRAGEVAIRTAIGASRKRLVAQSLVESGTLAALGGASGLVVAAAALPAVPRLAPTLPRLESVGIDGTVLGLTLILLVLVTLLFGVAPAVALARTPVRAALAVAVESPGRRRFRNGLLAIETGIAALLLVGAGLLLKSFLALNAVDLGFEPHDLSRFTVTVPEVRYDSLEKVRLFFRELEARIRTLPEVESVGSVWSPPLSRVHATGNVLVSGRPKPTPEEEREASIHAIGPGFMETMKMRLVKGRALVASDDLGPDPVAIVNERFADAVFPGEDPIGRQVTMTVDVGYGSPTWRIVGVIRDVRSRSLGDEPEAEIYVPHGLYGPESMTVTVRTRNGDSLIPAVRDIVRELDPDVPIYRIETVEQAVAREVAPTRFYVVLLGAFAALAAALAAVGIYGVVAYATARRTREIGLRLALGSGRHGVVALVVAQGMAPAAVGLAVGLVSAFAAARVMEAVLFHVEPRDPWIFVATGMLLSLVALAATIVPARRASRIDPSRALRVE